MINDSNRLNILLTAIILIAVISLCYLGIVEGLLLLIRNLVITICAVGGTLFVIFWLVKTDFSTKEIINKGLVFDVVEYKFIEGEGVSLFTNKSRISSVIEPIYNSVQKKSVIGYCFLLFVSWFSMVIPSVKNLSLENIYIEINRQITDELFGLVVLGLFSILYLFFFFELTAKWCIQLILEDTVHYFEERLGKPTREAYYQFERIFKELPLYKGYVDYESNYYEFSRTVEFFDEENIKKYWLEKRFDEFDVFKQLINKLRNYDFPSNTANQKKSKNYTLDEAYIEVGLSRNSSDEECRRRRKQLLASYHTDPKEAKFNLSDEEKHILIKNMVKQKLLLKLSEHSIETIF